MPLQNTVPVPISRPKFQSTQLDSALWFDESGWCAEALSWKLKLLVMGHHFVLVHGAWEWYKLADRLEKVGHKVTTLDLAGCGIHPADPDTITTYSEYLKPLTDFMISLPVEKDGEKVVLIGHSLMGFTNLQIVENFPEKVGLAISISSMLVPSGVKIPEFPPVQEYLAKKESPFSKAVEYYFNNEPDHPPTAWKVPPSKIGDILYNGCDSEVVKLAQIMQRSFPTTMLFIGSITYTPERQGQVPWVYFKCSQDRVNIPSQQKILVRLQRWLRPTLAIWLSSRRLMSSLTLF